MIADPQAVRFSNEEVRPLADAYANLYWTAKQFGIEWTAQGMDALIPSNTEVIADGSDVDGRAPITGAKVNGLKDAAAPPPAATGRH